MKGLVLGIASGLAVLLVAAALLGPVASAQSPVTGAIFTTLENGDRVNANIFADKLDVYLDGGPGPGAPKKAAGLPDGNYYFQVTDPSGKTLLSTDPVLCREFRAEGGVIAEYVSMDRTYLRHGRPVPVPCYMDGQQNGMHDLGFDDDHGSITIQLMPYSNTPNKGGVYKVWATPIEFFQGDSSNVDNPCGNGCFHGFVPAFSKTDNYKVQRGKPFETPQITVRKFLDVDGDGVWDLGEPEIGVSYFVDDGGWPVSIMDPNGLESSGYTPYVYLVGFAGTYVASEDVLSGWSQTAAYLDGVLQPLSPSVAVDVAFVSGERHEVVFGNFECFTISGYKYEDLNGDGTHQAGEPGILGWTVELFRNGGTTPYMSTTTDGTGFYSFEVCQGGEYTVKEEERDDWNPTSALSYTFTASSGVDHAFDFLNFHCFAVSGYKYDDLNGNGLHEEGEPVIAGWVISLYHADGSLVGTTETDSNGFYSFQVCAGGDYYVKETIPEGWIATNPVSGQFDFTAVSGQDQAFDFLNFKLGTICGFKFYDLNRNGVWDDGEPAIPGFKFVLLKDEVRIAEATTGPDGKYCFDDLTAGTYVVREVMPSDPDAHHMWVRTFPGSGSYQIVVMSGLDVQDANFGNVCVYTEGLTWGYWKTHTGYDSPPRDDAYDLLPANPMAVDIETPDGNYEINDDAEAKWLFDGTDPNCSGTPGVEKCRSLFRAQLLALHMNLLKFGDMGSQVYIYEGDPLSGKTVQQIYDDAVALLTDGLQHDFTSFQDTLDHINNNGEGTHVLVSAEPPTPTYP